MLISLDMSHGFKLGMNGKAASKVYRTKDLLCVRYIRPAAWTNTATVSYETKESLAFTDLLLGFVRCEFGDVHSHDP